MVERDGLENRWRRKALVGSNPTPSVLLHPAGWVEAGSKQTAMYLKIPGCVYSKYFCVYTAQGR